LPLATECRWECISDKVLPEITDIVLAVYVRPTAEYGMPR